MNYQIPAFDERGHVETSELNHDTDGLATATARLVMMPGERGECGTAGGWSAMSRPKSASPRYSGAG